MSILIDIQPLQSNARDAGIGTYLRNFLGELRRIEIGHPIQLLINDHSSRKKSLRLPRSVDWPTLVLERARPPDLPPWQREKLSYQRLFQRPDVMLYHCNSVAEHDQVTVAASSPDCRVITTAHDAIPLIFPEEHPECWKPELQGYDYDRKIEDLRQADLILTVSEHSKSDLLRYLGTPEHKIRVTYNGVSAAFRPIEDMKRVKRVREKYGLPDTYILYVGGYYGVRKNIARLLRAYDCYRRTAANAVPKLVLAGAATDRNVRGCGPLIQELRLEDHVHPTAFVNQRDLPVLYSEATLFFYPSLYEGFGLTPLEAMACGTPVVTSDNSSIPEVTGDAAKLVDPENVEEMADALNTVCSDPDYSRRLAQSGLRRARRFTWAETAARTLAAYRSVLE